MWQVHRDARGEKRWLGVQRSEVEAMAARQQDTMKGVELYIDDVKEKWCAGVLNRRVSVVFSQGGG